jgi:hypothetical protein
MSQNATNAMRSSLGAINEATAQDMFVSNILETPRSQVQPVFAASAKSASIVKMLDANMSGRSTNFRTLNHIHDDKPQVFSVTLRT